MWRVPRTLAKAQWPSSTASILDESRDAKATIARETALVGDRLQPARLGNRIGPIEAGVDTDALHDILARAVGEIVVEQTVMHDRIHGTGDAVGGGFRVSHG